jgi:hypothetical protein
MNDHLPRNNLPKSGTNEAAINPERTANNMGDRLKLQEKYLYVASYSHIYSFI